MDKNAQKTILLVEDDQFITRAYKLGLKKEGYNIVTASNGKEGLERLEESKPDLVLLDLVMPVMDGFEMLEQLRKQEKYKDLRVIVVSNLGQESDILEATKLGADDYVIKANYSMEEMLKKVQKHVAK